MQKTKQVVLLYHKQRKAWENALGNERVRVFLNGHKKPKVSGIPITIVSNAHLPAFSKGKPDSEGRLEMHRERARIAYEILERYIGENKCNALNNAQINGLPELARLMKIYATPHRLIETPQPITLDAALMQLKSAIRDREKTKINVCSVDDSELPHDYMLSRGLLAIANVLSFYLEPASGKIKVVLTRSADGCETQLFLKGLRTRPLSAKINGEAHNAIYAGLEFAGASLVSNENYFVLKIPNGEPSP